MDRKLLPLLIASLFAATPSAAQNLPAQWATEGLVTIGPIVTDIDGTDAAKAEQYRDLRDGALSNIILRTRSLDGFWLDLFGENFGRDDMYVNLRGGMYDSYKFRLFTDWLPQVRAIGARTPFTGAGSADLRATFPRPNPADWNTTDIGYDRRDTGGYFEWQRNSPWYFRVDSNQIRTDGTKIGAGANGTSPGNGFTDLIIPVDYRTTNASVEAGYNTPRYHFAVNYMVSQFESGNETLRWSNPFWGNGIDTTHLAPENDYQRISLNGTMRQLPWTATLAARFTWDKLESDTSLATSALNGANIFGLTNPNVPEFNGRVENTTFSLAWAAAPMRAVDVRAWYHYHKRENDSSHVEYRPVSGLACGTVTVGGVSSPGPCENELYAFDKWNAGVDAYWRVAKGHRFGAGVEYLHTDREHRADYDETKDKKFFVEYRNTMLDTLSARLKYTYLDRDSNFLHSDAGVDANDVLFLERFIGRFDASNLRRDEVKLIVDWNPVPLFDLSFEAIYRDNDYQAFTLGRTGDKRDEFYVSAAYGDPSKWRVMVFGDIENIRYDSFHRNIGAGSCPTTSGGVTATNCFDPSTPPNSIAYNWSAVNKDRNWAVGIGVDWPVMPKWLVKASYLYYRTDGKADIVTQNNFGNPLPLTAYDDSKKQSFNLKAIYDYSRNWQFTAGYAYEKYEYSDDQYNGYQFTVPFPAVSTNTSQSYLNGFNAFLPYKANIIYALATYRF